MNLVLAESRRLTADSQRLKGSLAARLSTTKYATDFWTFGRRRASPEIQKSSPFSSRFRQKTSRNKGSNAPRPASGGTTFGSLFLGPPGAHANPKVALGRSTSDSTRNARRVKGGEIVVTDAASCETVGPDSISPTKAVQILFVAATSDKNLGGRQNA
jgi:hypothetical protein